MRKVTAAFQVLLFSCLGIAQAGAQPLSSHNAKRITQFAVGIFCTEGVGVTNSNDPNTIKGTVERLDRTPLLVEETQTVPAIERITFGIVAREKIENGTVLITVTHPPLGASGQIVESWTTDMSIGEQTMSAYYLGLSDGNPVGRWTITGTSGAVRLFYAEFDVVPTNGSTIDPCTLKPVA